MSDTHPRSSFVIVFGVMAVLLLVVLGCGSNGSSDDGETMTITLTASPGTIEEGGTAVVEATVRDAGSRAADQSVSFTVSGEGEGYFTPATATTDTDGVAASVFTATSAGLLTLTARVSGTSVNASSNLTIQQAGTQQETGSISVTAAPSLLLANGSDTARITITVKDAAGQPAADQTVVKLAAGEKFVDIDGNGYWSAGVDSLIYDVNSNGLWDSWGLIPSSALITGGAGQVAVDYVSGNDATTVYIKATVSEGTIDASRDIQLQLAPNASIHSLYLASDSLQLSVRQTGGLETASLRAVAYDEFGNPVPEGLGVNFVIIDGPGGGEHLGAAGYGPYPAITNSQGVASAPFSSGTVSGTVRIRAYADTVLSNATQVLISAGPPAYIVVGVDGCNVPYWDEVAQTVDVVAVVSDVYLNPVNDSVAVYFSTDEGTMKSYEQRTRDHEGIARSKWISGNNVPTADGVVWVWAETGGGTVVDGAFFYNTGLPTSLQLSGFPVAVQADGISEYTVFVEGFDINSNPVVGGTAFEADAAYLAVEGGVLENGCGYASDRIKMKSASLLIDHSLTGSDDDGIGAVDTVQFWSGGTAFTSRSVQLLTGTAYSRNCEIIVQSSAVPDETVAVSALMQDRWGNPLGDHTLILSASAGTVGAASQETNAYGEASGFQWTAPAVAGTYTLTLTDVDPRGGISLVKSVTVQ